MFRTTWLRIIIGGSMAVAVGAKAESFNPADVSFHDAGAFGLSSFGLRIDGDGDRVAVAAKRADSTDGVVVVLNRHLGGINAWYPEAVIEPPEELVELQLATPSFPLTPIRIDGDTLAISYGGDDEAGTNAGAVFIYQRIANAQHPWAPVKKITPPGGAGGTGFGVTMALNGDTLAVGNYTYDGNSASVFLHHRHAGGENNWGLVHTLSPPGSAFWPEVQLVLDRDTLLIGDYYNEGNTNDSGVAYIHRRDAGGPDAWGLSATLTAPDGAKDDLFGEAVGLYEDTAVIGASLADDGTNTTGKVYVFSRNEGGSDAWGWVTTLIPEDPVPGMDFGRGVEIHGDTLLIAATDDEPTSAVYVYRRNRLGEDAWGPTARLSVTNTGFSPNFGLVDSMVFGPDFIVLPDDQNGRVHFFHNRFCPAWHEAAAFGTLAIPAEGRHGSAVALNERYGAVGQPGIGTTNGEVHVYARNEGGRDAWGLESVVDPPSQFSANARFGAALALDGDVLAVGAPDATFLSDPDATGAMALYQRNPPGTSLSWASGRILLPPPGSDDGDQFGAAVALERGCLVVGAPLHDGAEENEGAVYVYRHLDTISNLWTLVTGLSPSSLLPEGAQFGRSVAISRDTIAVAARGASTNTSSPASVHLFRRNLGGADAWGEARVLTGFAVAHDFISAEVVALDGDVLAVGAPFESEGIEINSGAVYVFHRNEGGPDNWGLVARLTSPDVANGGLFGLSVSVKGDVIVVGETGSSPPDVLASGAGRAFLFHRNEGGLDAWGLVRELENPSPEVNGQFGAAVALGYDGAMVGEPMADLASTNRGQAHLFTPDCIPVTILEDVVDGGDRENSLREAIDRANEKTNGTASILLPQGTLSIQIAGSAENGNATGDFDLTNTSVRIELLGAGPDRTLLDGGQLDRVFQAFPGVTGLISGVTISNGLPPAGFSGGAIRNAGDLEIERCQIMRNHAGDGAANGDGGDGGGIWNSGSLAVRRSTLYFNRAGDAGVGSPPGASGRGGAIYSSGDLIISSSTIASSFAGDGSSAGVDDGDGGGIYATGPVTIRHSTLKNNEAGTGGHLYATQPVTLRFSIVDNSDLGGQDDMNATLAAPLYNVISDTTGITVSPAGDGNLINVDPMVDTTPFSHGGGMLTYVLLPGSPAIDAGTTNVSGFIAAEDQRGVSRTGAAAPLDIGAIEMTDDFDGDGIPDDFERATGSNPEEAADAPQDADRDGFTAAEEYLADTDWQDGADVLAISTLEAFPNLGYTHIDITGYSSNRTYNLEYALPPLTNWLQESWSLMGGGTNALFQYVDLFPVGKLWRITASPP